MRSMEMEILAAGLPQLALIASYLTVLAVLSIFGLHRWQLVRLADFLAEPRHLRRR